MGFAPRAKNKFVGMMTRKFIVFVYGNNHLHPCVLMTTRGLNFFSQTQQTEHQWSFAPRTVDRYLHEPI